MLDRDKGTAVLREMRSACITLGTRVISFDTGSDEKCDKAERALLMQMFHGRCAEDNEESNPQCGTLIRDRFVASFFAVVLIGFEDDGVEVEGHEAEHKKQLDEEDRQVLSVVWNTAARLRGNDLIHIMEIDSAREQEHEKENPGDFLIVLIEDICNGLDLWPGHRLLEAGRDGHDKERQAADPNHRGQQVKPVIDNGDEDIEIGHDALECVHLLTPCGVKGEG